MKSNIATLCEELKAVRETRSTIQAQLKEIDATIAQLKNDIISAMNDSELEECVTGGYRYTVNTSYIIEKQCDSKEFVQLCRKNQRNDLITEYVNPFSLRSFVASELETNDELPSWLLGSVRVKETQKLSIQKK